VLNIAFRWSADERASGDKKMLILDLKDLRQVIDEMGKKAAELRSKYGNIAPQTVGVIQRRLLVLERDGAEPFFGEPALELSDLMRTAPDGRGYVSVLDATTLTNSPRTYGTFLMGIWEPCLHAVKNDIPLDKAKDLVLKDPRVAARARTMQGFADNIGKYTSLAYLEAEKEAF